MRAISLWQPWATAVALGSKRVETRHWATSYRGPLAIHAAKRRVQAELQHYTSCWNWVGAMRGAGWAFGTPTSQLIDALPFGAVVAVCELVDCRRSEDFSLGELEARRREDRDATGAYAWTERQMGDFGAGRYGWALDNIRPLRKPLTWRGGQSFFQVPDVEIGALLDCGQHEDLTCSLCHESFCQRVCPGRFRDQGDLDV
jgi:hypothetical protein